MKPALSQTFMVNVFLFPSLSSFLEICVKEKEAQVNHNLCVMFVPQRQFVIPTSLPAVGVQGADLVDENSGEVHVYAHPSKVVNNLQHPKEREKV